LLLPEEERRVRTWIGATNDKETAALHAKFVILAQFRFRSEPVRNASLAETGGVNLTAGMKRSLP
jgi:hypothetical protein